MPNEYGILIYDVPTKNTSLYNRLRKRISKKAVRMNLSVYLLLWGMKEQLQDLIDETIRETGQTATVNIIKFDGSDKTKIEQIARESLRNDVSETIGRLQKKIAKLQEEAKEVSAEYFNKVKERLLNAENLAVLFGFDGDLGGIFETARRVWQLEWETRRARLEALREQTEEPEEPIDVAKTYQRTLFSEAAVD